MDRDFDSRIALLERFKEKFSDPAPVQEQIDALRESEKNLKEYQEKITPFFSDLPAERPIPNEFLCPITRKDMEYPVFYWEDAGAGKKQRHYFERDAIHEWLQTNKTSPLSRAQLTVDQLQADLEMKEKINAWRLEPYNSALAALRTEMASPKQNEEFIKRHDKNLN